MDQLVADASTLDERLDGVVRPLDDGDIGSAPVRYERWREFAAAGADDVLERRLQHFGHTARSVLPLLGPVVPASEPPAWAALAIAWSEEVRGSSLEIRDDREFPFTELTAPLGRLVRRRLDGVASMSSDVIDRLEEFLVVDLARIASLSLYVDLGERAPFGFPAGHYASTVQRWAATGLEDLYLRRPVLIRACAERASQWLDSMSELMIAWRSDAALVRALVDADQRAEVREVTLDWSDRHVDGRSVAVVDFGGGRRAVYKPRSLRRDATLRGLVDELRARGISLPEVPAVALSADHGWARFVDAEPAGDDDAIAGYARRAGGLVALTWLLGAQDLIADNIVANATVGPVPVDVEFLLTEMPPADPLRSPLAAAADLLFDAFLDRGVLATGLLPRWLPAGTDSLVVSGLLGEIPPRPMRFRGVGSDQLALVRPASDNGMRHHSRLRRVVHDDEPTDAQVADFGLDIAAAVGDALSALSGETGSIRAAADAIAQERARLVFRPTMFYNQAMRAAAAPSAMRHGVDRSIALEGLASPVGWTSELATLHRHNPDAGWMIIDAERRALERGDIPLFTATPGSRTVWTCAGGVVPAALGGVARTDLEQRLELIEREDEIERQQRVVAAAFDAHRRTRVGRGLDPEPVAPPSLEPPAAPLDLPAAVRRRAVDIADELARQAVWFGDDPTPSWMTVGDDERLRTCTVQAISPRLYDGRAGIGLFLVTVGVRADRSDLVELGVRTLDPLVRELLHGDVPGLVGEHGWGAATGVPSVAYALVRAGRELGDQQPIAAAARAVVGLPAPERGSPVDVTHGVAGAVLAACSVYERSGAVEVADAVTVLGDRLVDLVECGGDSPVRAVGAAHGLAGVAMALARLASVTGADSHRRAAAQYADCLAAAMASLVPGGGPASTTPIEATPIGWCRGHVGVAVTARACGLGDLADAALDAIDLDRPVGDDTLCCGNAGAVAIAGLDSTVRARRAWTLASQPIAGLRLDTPCSRNRARPGLFSGLAGVGWGLLAAGDPELSELLSWT